MLQKQAHHINLQMDPLEIPLKTRPIQTGWKSSIDPDPNGLFGSDLVPDPKWRSGTIANTRSNRVCDRQEMGYSNEGRVRCNWLSWSLGWFRVAFGKEKGFAMSFGIYDQVWQCRQCAAVWCQASLWRKLPDWRHWQLGYGCTNCSLGPH